MKQPFFKKAIKMFLFTAYILLAFTSCKKDKFIDVNSTVLYVEKIVNTQDNSYFTLYTYNSINQIIQIEKSNYVKYYYSYINDTIINKKEIYYNDSNCFINTTYFLNANKLAYRSEVSKTYPYNNIENLICYTSLFEYNSEGYLINETRIDSVNPNIYTYIVLNGNTIEIKINGESDYSCTPSIIIDKIANIEPWLGKKNRNLIKQEIFANHVDPTNNRGYNYSWDFINGRIHKEYKEEIRGSESIYQYYYK